MNDKRNSELLAGIDAFEGLGEEELDLLGTHFRRRAFRKGDVLIREGEQVSDLSIIISGSVEILLPEEGSEFRRFSEVKLDTIGPGHYLGEYSVLDLRPASATAVALEYLEVLQIGAGDLQHLLNEHCEIARYFYRNLALILIDRLRRTNLELDMFTTV